MILFIVIKSSIGFVESSKIYNETLLTFRKDAINDMKNDNVKSFSQGLELPHKNEEMQIKFRKADSIQNIYGLHRKNLGCTIMPSLTKSQEEYYRITKPYLDKRNGKGWEEKMKKEIENINKN